MNNRAKAKLLNGIGTGIMVVVIVLMIPLTIPKLFGISLYEVMSESMEPLYKVGGVVYVKPATPDEVEVGDIISYVTSSGTNIVTTHRVYEITDDGTFITKGDANNTVDAEPVVESRLVGKAVFYLPFLGAISAFIFSVKGACVCIMIFGLSVIMWIWAGMISPKEEKQGDNTESVPKEKAKKNANLFTLAGVGIIICALIAAGIWGYSYIKGQNEYKDIRNELKLIIDEKEVEVKDNDASYDVKSEGAKSNKEIVFADSSDEEIALSFDVLSTKYKNLIGWITIPDTVIDYPIMHYSDDAFYLRHSYDGSYLRSGSIFLSAQNNGDMSDRYNMIYGHNMNDGYMFSSLLKYDTEAGYFEAHPNIYITTREGMGTYQIFSFFYVYPTDAMYSIAYYNMADYDILVNNMKSVSRIETGVDISEEDDIVVLTTCNSRAKYRFVVCAKRKPTE